MVNYQMHAHPMPTGQNRCSLLSSISRGWSTSSLRPGVPLSMPTTPWWSWTVLWRISRRRGLRWWRETGLYIGTMHLFRPLPLPKIGWPPEPFRKKFQILRRLFPVQESQRRALWPPPVPEEPQDRLRRCHQGYQQAGVRSCFQVVHGGSSCVRSVFCIQDDYVEKSLHINIFLARTLAVL